MADFDSELLRRARELAGLTAAELAERAELHPVTVAKFEGGLRPSADSWERLQTALRGALDEAEQAIRGARKRLSSKQ